MSSKVATKELKVEVEIAVEEQYKKFVGRKILFICAILILIVAVAGVSATIGTYPITVSEVYSIIWRGFFHDPMTIPEVIVWELRLPVILMGILAGIGLAVAGAMMQGVLKNPLASPFTLGISAGAGFGAALAILFGAGVAGGGAYLVVLNAFFFSLIPTLVIIGLTRYKRATPETMVLAGIAMLHIFGALTTLMMYFGEPDAVKEAYFWMVGSLGRATWDNIVPVFILLVACLIPLLRKAWDLNVLGAGDDAAKSLGVNVERERIIIMAIASLMTAGIISFVGTIGFIGLVAPHICRMVIGGDNRFLIPASGLLGAVILLGADTIARSIMAPIILPVGVITAALGGPLFLYLLIRRKKEYW
jgi:iron complex transport system permease protein